ncbi:MAG TPA: protein kinase [Kofleriaceae bacterium]|nr:protein kinase [Kofleriaceae bacterium]
MRKLAEGGMGTVYLAEHVLIRRRVALKLLHSELAEDSAMIRRFMNEASAAGMLGHPHIVESTDMGFTRHGIPYIVFEYLEGTLLIEEVYRLVGLPVRRALHIASQIASALDAAHNAKIVHLDLKSDNVFLIDRGDSVDHVKILDFGISRFLEVDVDRTQVGQLAGTPEFMAPEQVTMPDQVDGRADIYALGVLLYEMLCARCPHANSDRRMLLHQVVHDAPAPLDRPVPEDLERLLFDRLLAKSRDDRIQTMAEVKAALDDIATSLRAGASDTLFAFEDPSLEIHIDIGAIDDALPVDEPAPAASEPGAPAGLETGTRAASESGARAANEAGTRAVSESGARAAIETRPRAVSEPEALEDLDTAHGRVLLSASGPVPVLAPAAARASVPVRRGPRALFMIAAMLAGTAGGALWFAEHHPAQMLGDLRRAAWMSSAVLLSIYTLGWLVYGFRALWRVRSKP